MPPKASVFKKSLARKLWTSINVAVCCLFQLAIELEKTPKIIFQH